MVKHWFVLHALTGQENSVKKSIDSRVRLERMEEYIGRCEVPTERVVEKRKDGKKHSFVRKFFPGYVFCELALYDESKGVDDNGRKTIYDRTWQFLRETPGVIGFIGGERPMPLKQSEIDAILTDKPAGAPDEGRLKVDFAINEVVRIADGAFKGLTGQISVVDPSKGKLRVDVHVFGRTTPVDAEYWQVEKLPEGEAFDVGK